MVFYIFTLATIDLLVIKHLIFFTIDFLLIKHLVFFVAQSGIDCILSNVHRRMLVNRVNNSGFYSGHFEYMRRLLVNSDL
jgi:hypothetical protein